ncbi:hypothetical protein J4T85_019450 [Sinorhizobium medicae]|uniref:hypothetical protein n=1 Tax=Sinorhizobium medicae TaxID=110321 RepID=UPI001AAE7E39|nr:hypothetical protein [Sinorhizobium medicae]MBO1963885.1 hypothetical protein [Sinorhizobium medicae]
MTEPMARYPEPVPRKDLFTNRDADAWAEQFHMLRYVLHMSALQIAQIDYGMDPDHPDAWMVFSWAHNIDRQFPRVDVKALMRASPGL